MNKPFTVKIAILLCVLLGALQLVFGLGFGFFLALHKLAANQFVFLFGTNVIELLSFGVVFLIGLNKTEKGIANIVKLHKVKFDSFLYTILFVFGFVIVSSEFDNLFQSVFPIPAFLKSSFDSFFFCDSFILSLLSIAIIPVFLEESFFRGLLITGLMKKYSSRKAIIISSLLFSVIHLNPWQSIPAFFIGIICGIVFVRTNSLVLCILIHFVNNFVSVLAARYPELFATLGISSAAYTGKPQPLWIDIMGLIILATGLGLLLKSIENKKKLTV